MIPMPQQEKVIRVKVEHDMSPQMEKTIKDLIEQFTRTFAGQF